MRFFSLLPLLLLSLPAFASGKCSLTDPSLTLREIVEGLQEMSPPEIREEFDLCQPLILCDAREHRILDEQKTAAQLRLPDGFKILIY